MDIPSVLTRAVAQLHGETQRLDAEVLLCHVLRKERIYLHSHREHELTAAQQARFDALLRRRIAGEPVAYLVGEKEFWSMRLEVTADTLIPRPDTELLVSVALQQLAENATSKVAELGTGSGAVALALASERPHLDMVATDVSAAALEVARRNAHRHGVTNIGFRQGDWLAALENERYAMIISNPPYVAANDPHLQQAEVRCEPQLALAAGDDGLAAIRAISDGARAHLVQHGKLLLEHGFDQDDAVRRLLAGLGYTQITLHRDLAGLPRVTSASWPAN